MACMENAPAFRTLALLVYAGGTCFIAFAIVRGVERLLDLLPFATVADDSQTKEAVPSHRFTDRFCQGLAADLAVTLGPSGSKDYRFIRLDVDAGDVPPLFY